MVRKRAFFGSEVHPIPKALSVWFKEGGSNEWLLGESYACNGTTCEITYNKNVRQIPCENVVRACVEANEGPSNLAKLSPCNELSILQTLKMRFIKGLAYTETASLLVAMNPYYASQASHSSEEMKNYIGSSLHLSELEPHIFKIAFSAYRLMKSGKKSQAIILMGKTASGKTAVAKHLLAYFSTNSSGFEVHHKLAMADVALKAFGHAKTTHNPDGNCFGKAVKAQFDKDSMMVGAHTYSLLFDKGRVVNRVEGERSFHIFYQLLGITDLGTREALHIPLTITTCASKFNYIANSNCLTVPNMDDGAKFNDTVAALTALGCTPDVQEALWSLLSAILWMGNLAFEKRPDQGEGAYLIYNAEDPTSSDDSTAVAAVMALLGVEYEALSRALTFTGGAEPKKLSTSEACTQRDTLAQELYNAIFSWLLANINAQISVSTHTRTITILDIPGYTSTPTNGFPQLAINAANERLQQLFYTNIMRPRKEEYDSQHVNWQSAFWDDNQDCVELLEGKAATRGILQVIFEATNQKLRSDAELTKMIRESNKEHPRFTVEKGKNFTVQHSFGDVQYSVQSMAEGAPLLGQGLLELLPVAWNSTLGAFPMVKPGVPWLKSSHVAPTLSGMMYSGSFSNPRPSLSGFAGVVASAMQRNASTSLGQHSLQSQKSDGGAQAQDLTSLSGNTMSLPTHKAASMWAKAVSRMSIGSASGQRSATADDVVVVSGSYPGIEERPGLFQRRRTVTTEYKPPPPKTSNGVLSEGWGTGDSPRGGRTAPAPFIAQLRSLFSELEAYGKSSCHFVCCVRANVAGVDKQFEDDFVMEQLRNGCVTDALYETAYGYPDNTPFPAFVERFRPLSKNPRRFESQYTKEAVTALMTELGFSSEKYTLGDSQIFMRPGVLEELEAQAEHLGDGDKERIEKKMNKAKAMIKSLKKEKAKLEEKLRLSMEAEYMARQALQENGPVAEFFDKAREYGLDLASLQALLEAATERGQRNVQEALEFLEIIWAFNIPPQELQKVLEKWKKGDPFLKFFSKDMPNGLIGVGKAIADQKTLLEIKPMEKKKP